MAVKLTDSRYCVVQCCFVNDYVADTAEDVTTLPNSGTGSTAIVVATGEIYMVNASGEWAKFGGEA